MLKVKVNDGTENEISFSGTEVILNGNNVQWDQVKIADNRFHILMNNRSFDCEVISSDVIQKSFEIKVNGKVTRVIVKDRFDELLHQLGMDITSETKVNIIKAPMPGLVLKIMVKAGEEILAGDPVLVLEAMKMENIIKSPGSGSVKIIHVQERSAVEKNQVLIELA